MLQFALLVLTAVAAVASPAPELEARAGPACKTRQAGILSARYFAPWINYRAFTLSNDGQIAYKGDGQKPLVVEFQPCSYWNAPNTPYDDYHYGHLYVPSKDKCLAAKDQQKPSDPYWTKLEPCAQSWAQRWVLHPTHSNDIFWVGNSDNLQNGAIKQGGCGVLGWTSNGPNNTGSPGPYGWANKQRGIQLVCDDFNGFNIRTSECTGVSSGSTSPTGCE